MYHFRYYAIGHSYLKHGPFVGWQTSGFWGMAASAPECDYFHKLQDGLTEAFDCKVEAIAENQAAFERLCTEDATEEKYTSSAEYAHMRDVLEGFKPNLITLYIGGGNTPAKDDASLTLFFKVLYGLVSDHKRPEAVVICIGLRPNIHRISQSVADGYGFISVDASFLHEPRSRDNPYYAFRDYPEYDERAALGAVEFRTHPNDLGHAAIAEAILSASKDAIAKIPEGAFPEAYSYDEYRKTEAPARLRIETEPRMTVSYFGFNVRQNGDCVTFGSAPGTGASVTAEDFRVPAGSKTLFVELAVDGAGERDVLRVCLKGISGETEYALPILPGMRQYEVALPADGEEIRSLRIAPSTMECVVTVKRIGFRI